MHRLTSSEPDGGTGTGTGPASDTASSAPATASRYTKVLLVVEENEDYSIVGSPPAPYLSSLAHPYGLATNMDAGYPLSCPSLPGYLILTSGSDPGICDDDDPSRHPIRGDNRFQQVAVSGRQWRGYAESMPGPCSAHDSPDGAYLVRHAPAPYYVSERSRCGRWDVPLGTSTVGALHNDIAAGHLPSFAVVTPNACHDMHGASAYSGDPVSQADDWLSGWIPQIMSGPDYRSGWLAVVITGDEGGDATNHIPTVVVSPTTRNITDPTARTHCSTVRTVEDVLGLPALGCGAHASSMTQVFRL